MIRALWLALALTSTACSFDANYNGTLFACGANGACPNDYVCREQRCVPTSPPIAACTAAIATGVDHSCAIRSDGTVWCWGLNDSGQLGDPSGMDHTTPVQVPGITHAVALAGGESHSCAIDSAGKVSCWGLNDSGQLGNAGHGNSTTPVSVVGLPGGATAIAAGDDHTCAILADKTVACWGQDDAGQLGDLGNSPRNMPYGLTGLTGVTSLAAGGSTTCAVDGKRALWCWGNDNNGQLGDGGRTASGMPIQVALADVASVAVGAASSCALTTSGEVVCFGVNDVGELGNSTTAQQLPPVPVALPPGIAASAITVGDRFACAIDGQGQVWCWGNNQDFQLADGTNGDTAIPVRSRYSDITAIAAGDSHFCALAHDGSVTCSGFDGRGELGNGQRTTQPTPQPVAGLTNAISIAAGDSHTCATLGDPAGSVVCWGENDHGELGDGTVIPHAAPAPVQGVRGAKLIVAGQNHTCALLVDQTVVCWGENFHGELGDGTTDSHGVARHVVDQANQVLAGVTQLAAGGEHTCAVATGSLVCWGRNSDGELGDGLNPPPKPPQLAPPPNTDSHFAQPATLPSGMNSPIVSLAAGTAHTCVANSDHNVLCWGRDGDAELGNGQNFGGTSSPGPVMNLASVDQLSAHGMFTCAHTTSGSVFCWGNDGNGQLGNGSTQGGTTPVMTHTSGVAKVVAGGSHTCALMATTGVGGSIQCWGGGSTGQLGTGEYDDENQPVAISALSNVIDIAAGARHTCALLGDHSVRCWGDDRAGQLGDGVTASPLPVAPLLTCPAH